MDFPLPDPAEMLSLCCAAKMSETHNVMSRVCANATVFLLFSLDEIVVSKMHFLSTSWNFWFAFVMLLCMCIMWLYGKPY